jgi:hypothetical protein
MRCASPCARFGCARPLRMASSGHSRERCGVNSRTSERLRGAPARPRSTSRATVTRIVLLPPHQSWEQAATLRDASDCTIKGHENERGADPKGRLSAKKVGEPLALEGALPRLPAWRQFTASEGPLRAVSRIGGRSCCLSCASRAVGILTLGANTFLALPCRPDHPRAAWWLTF